MTSAAPVGVVTVVGLGPADATLVTSATAAAIASSPRCFVRTTRHPAVAQLLAGAECFDAIYDRAQHLDEVYPAIVEALVAAAGAVGRVLYAVPGSPLVAERSVELLRADPRVVVDILPSLSFLDLAWARLGVDPLAAGVRLVDGHRFAVEAAGQAGPLLVAQCDSGLVLSDIKLSVDDPRAGAGGPAVVVLQRLGLPDEAVFPLAWEDLDRAVDADHLTSLWIPSLADPVAAELVRLDELVHLLRQRCPWDRRQTHRSLTRHLVEETYEVLEAIDGLGADGQGAEHLEEELGDLLFQVVLHATLAAEAGQFTLADVARGIHDKLVHRHPHVFGTDPDGPPAATWEELKRQEKGRSSIMDGIPGHLPSLIYAHKVQRKAASVGFDWDDVTGAWAKIAEETAELQAAMAARPAGAVSATAGATPEVVDELGDLLFAVVNVARHLEVDAEWALRAAAQKFRSRFLRVEALGAERGSDLADLGPAELDALWNLAKTLDP